MRIVRPILVLSVVLFFAFIVSGQIAPKAYKVAEFGLLSQGKIDEKMRELCIEVRKNPTSEGYIMNYGTPSAIRTRRSHLFRNFRCGDLDPPRITFVDGKSEPKIRTVIWIVPPGATPPTP
jgi:hypothetical protein